MIGKLTSQRALLKWTLSSTQKREYGTVQNLPFYEARDYLMAVPYNGQSGRGQQRDIVKSHARKLKKEMEAGTFTPANFSAGCSKNHRAAVVMNQDGTFTLPVNSDDPLLLTDGGHRFEAMVGIVKELEEGCWPAAADRQDKRGLTRGALSRRRRLSFTVTIYFDGGAGPGLRPPPNRKNARLTPTTCSVSGFSARCWSSRPCRLAFDVCRRCCTRQDGSPLQNPWSRFGQPRQVAVARQHPARPAAATSAPPWSASLVSAHRATRALPSTPPLAGEDVVVSAFKSN